MNKLSKRSEAALAIRDAALQKIRAEGIFEEIPNFGPTLVWPEKASHKAPLHMMLRTPFQKIPKVSVENRKKALQHGLAPEGPNLSYGLDIWTTEGKVFNIEWGDAGKTKIVNFKRGAWEETVLAWGLKENG